MKRVLFALGLVFCLQANAEWTPMGPQRGPMIKRATLDAFYASPLKCYLNGHSYPKNIIEWYLEHYVHHVSVNGRNQVGITGGIKESYAQAVISLTPDQRRVERLELTYMSTTQTSTNQGTVLNPDYVSTETTAIQQVLCQ